MRLTRDPLARANGTIEAVALASDGRPAATTASLVLDDDDERSDPQYGPNCTSADRTDCVVSVVVVLLLMVVGSVAGTGCVEELIALLLLKTAALHSLGSTTTVRASAWADGNGG